MKAASGAWKHSDGTRLWLYANGESWGYVPGKDKPQKNGTFWNYDAFQAWLRDRGYECVEAPPSGFEVDPSIRADTLSYAHTPEGLADHEIRILLLADAVQTNVPSEDRVEFERNEKIKQLQQERRKHATQKEAAMSASTGKQCLRKDQVEVNGVRITQRGVQCIELFKKLGKDINYKQAREATREKGLGHISDMSFAKYMKLAFGKDWKASPKKSDASHPWRDYRKKLEKDPATRRPLFEGPRPPERKEPYEGPVCPSDEINKAIALIVEVNQIAARCGGRVELRKLLDQLDELSGVITRG